MLRLFGLPAHPLLVHFPVVAIPTLSLVALIMAIRPAFRERYGIAISLLGVVTTIATFLAAASGEALSDEFGFTCLLYTSPSPRDRTRSRMPSSA